MKLNISTINSIAGLYGDSFYILDSKQFAINYLELEKSFRDIYPNSYIAYSYKTNYIPKLCKLVNELGGYAEVVSDMEYEIAKRVGVKSEKIIFNGPYKNKNAVEELLLSGGTVNIDSEYELPFIVDIANRNINKILNVGIRCTFDINDGVISRFGFDIDSDDFLKTLDLLKKYKNINLVGVHCHFATRTIDTWMTRAEGMISLVEKYFNKTPQQIDLGGGLFGKMSEFLKEQFDSYIPNYNEYANVAATVIAKHFTKEEKPMLFIEPGSALVGDSMKFVSKVVNIKNNRGKPIATLLGSIYNINPTLNKKNPPITIFSNGGEQKEYVNLDFGGFTCIESDYLYRGYSGKLAVNDYVVFDNVGSYSVVLKPPFILPNFAIVDYNDELNKVQLIKRQETFDDLFHTFVFED